MHNPIPPGLFKGDFNASGVVYIPYRRSVDLDRWQNFIRWIRAKKSLIALNN